MTDQVISEIRFIETDDGYRVEIKGDKEMLKQMGFMHQGFGPGMFFGKGRRFRGRRHGHGPHPWAWECDKPTAGEAAPPEETEA